MAVFYLTIIQSPTPVFLLATQSMKSLSPNKSSRQSSANTQLSVENLEPRMMLSTVEIFAAGTSGFEQFELQINGAAVQTFTAGSGIESRNFQSFVFETPETITAGDVSIEFLNDFFDPSTGFDSNLAIDAIVVDGTRFETEEPNGCWWDYTLYSYHQQYGTAFTLMTMQRCLPKESPQTNTE